MWRIDFPKVLLAVFMLAASLLLSAHPSLAAGAKKAEKAKPNASEKVAKSESPINIKADRMEAKQEEKTVLFEGHVVVQQDDLTITGNRLKVVGLPGEKTTASTSANESASTPTDRIDYIEVEGDVRVTQQDRLATANKAIFYQKDQKIVLHGHPVVTKGQDRVEGNLITVYIQQGRSVVEGGNGAQVQAVLFPGKKE